MTVKLWQVRERGRDDGKRKGKRSRRKEGEREGGRVGWREGWTEKEKVLKHDFSSAVEERLVHALKPPLTLSSFSPSLPSSSPSPSPPTFLFLLLDREPSPEDEAGEYTLRQRVRTEDPQKLRATLKAAQRMALSRYVLLLYWH